MAFVMFTFMKYSQGFSPPLEEAPGAFGVVAILFKHFDLLALFQINLAVFIIIASIYFLKLHAWARTALEVVSWLGLTYIVGFGIFWLTAWISASVSMSGGKAPSSESLVFGIFGAVMGVVVIAVYATPLIVIIKFLRGKTIREAVR